mmetsp:Transcript_5931/g.19629  ORF Transcript_5931/g.19629 Transcript_5931/m.19629 type:complete len:160 (-) Transcript_5931:259-738(-)
MQPMFDEAFPTGRSRTDIRPLEVLAFVASPALYPSRALVAVTHRRAWGHAGAMQAALVCLTVGFAFQASERLGLDLYCYPYAWLQPTAVLHVCSALTIAAGYVWLRSIEAPPPETDCQGGMTNLAVSSETTRYPQPSFQYPTATSAEGGGGGWSATRGV